MNFPMRPTGSKFYWIVEQRAGRPPRQSDLILELPVDGCDFLNTYEVLDAERLDERSDFEGDRSFPTVRCRLEIVDLAEPDHTERFRGCRTYFLWSAVPLGSALPITDAEVDLLRDRLLSVVTINEMVYAETYRKVLGL